jgi:hypothetical protein
MVVKPVPATTGPTLPFVPYPLRIRSLTLFVDTPVTCGTLFPNVAVAGRAELGSNGDAVFAPLMPKIVAVETPDAVSVTVTASLDRGLAATAYHSSRFSFPSLDTRILLEKVR